MTLDEVRDKIEEIRNILSDDEHSHSLEDKLYIKVLQSIANKECESPSELAELALETQKLDFSRWCA